MSSGNFDKGEARRGSVKGKEIQKKFYTKWKVKRKNIQKNRGKNENKKCVVGPYRRKITNSALCVFLSYKIRM
jgi:hypothetical protein